MTERRDPVLGALPELDEGSTGAPRADAPRALQRARPAASGMRRAWPWLLGVGVVTVIASALALHHWRDAISARLVPPPQQTNTMQQADAALRAGKLTSPDGRGARELYQAVLARDPDHLAAREGLVRVGAAALAQAQAAMKEQRPLAAQRALDLARDLAVPIADLQPVEQALQRGKGSDDQIGSLLTRAADAERADHVDDGGGSALALYQQALAAAPGNAVVLARRQALITRMLAGVDPLIARGDITGAQKLVDRVATVDPGNLDLPAARGRLGEVAERRQSVQTHALEQADADARDGRLDAAITGYRKVLANEPDNPHARGGLRAVAEAMVMASRRAIADFDFARAESYLAQARGLAPGLPTLHAAEQYLAQVRARQAGMGERGKNVAKVEDLLAAADHAIVRNELVDPPGDSAFDKLRAAAAIAPGDPRVIVATQRFVATSAACYQRDMAGNRLASAQSCFDALIAIQPAYPKLPSMRQELAARWLAIADERIGAGELGNARRAIASAQQLAPNDPAIPALQTRLQQAQAGTHH